MRNRLAIFALLFVCATCMHAQQGSWGIDVWQSPNYPSTIQGCLLRAGMDYVVIGNDGFVYNLTGFEKGLRPYVGREVEVRGKPIILSISTTVENAASTVQEIPALQVKAAMQTSGTCTLPTPRPPECCCLGHSPS